MPKSKWNASLNAFINIVIKLEILTSDRIVDLSREEVDFSVRYGPGHKDGAVNRQLTKGVLVPVCAPGLYDGDCAKDLQGFLSQARRIQMFSNNEWRKWSETAGVEIESSRSPFIIEDFLVGIEAVLARQGVALMPEILVRDYLRAGEMRLFSQTSVDWNQTHYIAYMAGAERRPAVREVIDWLFNEVAADALTID